MSLSRQYEGNGGCADVHYTNVGSGRFVAELTDAVTGSNGPTTVVGFADIDGDGDLDTLLGSVGKDYMFWNVASASFTDVLDTPLTAGNANCRAIAVGDLVSSAH